MGQSSWVTLEDCRIIKTTERAILIQWPEADCAERFPKALEEGDEGVTVLVSEKIARDKGIEV